MSGDGTKGPGPKRSEVGGRSGPPKGGTLTGGPTMARMNTDMTKDHGPLDRLQRALERERGHRRLPRWPLEHDSVFKHVFTCECCGRQRREEDRREPRSEVCIQCVRAAGFEWW
jgi:hypothetical protein